MVFDASKSDGRYHGLTRATILPRRLFMVPLIAAAMLGVKQPAANADFDPPGPDVFCARNAITYALCQLSSVSVNEAFVLPELGGSFDFYYVLSNAHFVMGTDGARLTGDIREVAGGNKFSVAIDFTGAHPADPDTVDMLIHPACADPNTWIQFTGITGELVGLPGSPYVDTRYAITKRSNDAQLGLGANTHNVQMGLFAKINFELIDNPHDVPDLPVGPFAGEVSFIIPDAGLDENGVHLSCFPPAEPDLTGTWTGTIDCVGFDAESAFGATPVERLFSAAVLKIGRSTNALDVGDQYSVRLTREAGNAQSYCAYAPNNPGSTTGGQGGLVEPYRHATRVYFRFEGETLKARELKVDGLDGTQLCKWNFTRASTTPPTVPDACSPPSCYTNSSINQCGDNAICGQGNESGDGHTCTCEAGYYWDDWSGDCIPMP